jgi:hypothetical protein
MRSGERLPVDHHLIADADGKSDSRHDLANTTAGADTDHTGVNLEILPQATQIVFVVGHFGGRVEFWHHQRSRRRTISILTSISAFELKREFISAPNKPTAIGAHSSPSSRISLSISLGTSPSRQTMHAYPVKTHTHYI